ncbi:hypothetical protein [Vibrio owensii]|uniref:hypothetical protein n=1 Tax=Vibrio harveyi group TaxID=717610 RepID=UPI003CC6538E
MDIIYRENGTELRVGDKVQLTAAIKDDGFLNSKLGQLFAKKVCDTAIVEVIQTEWLEVKFKLTLKKDGNPVTFHDVEDDPDEVTKKVNTMDCSLPDVQRFIEHLESPFYEYSDYMFLRYFLRKGAQVVK